MKGNLKNFKAFLKQRESASLAWVNGDAQPLRPIATRKSPATFMGPGGGYEEGATHVFAVYEKDAGRFESGQTKFDIVHMEAGDDLAFFTGIQRAKIRGKGQSKAMSMDLRVTEVFRRENDGWKMVHRHADPLAVKQKPPKKPRK